MTTRKETITFCHICGNHCALTAVVEDGKLVEVKAGAGFPANMCNVQKGADHLIGTSNSPDRLTKPLRRVGEKGEGKWEEISWNDALDIIAEKLIDVKVKYGPDHVIMVLGEPKGMEFLFEQRFATAFGTPNTITPGNYCGVQNTEAMRFTFGQTGRNVVARMSGNPKVMVLWGTNLAHTGGSFQQIFRRDFNEAIVSGNMRLVVIDPKDIELWPEKGMRASHADYWLKPRPQSDGVLAMGFIKVIIDEKLYDRNYIDTWTIGFDELCKEVEKVSLDEVEQLTWVPKKTIQEVARLIATLKPSIVASGNAVEGNISAFQMSRALSIIRAITASVNTPDGGFTTMKPAKYYPPGAFMMSDLKAKLKEYPRTQARTIGGNDFALPAKFGYLPTQALVDSLLSEKPFLPKVGLTFVNNPLLTYADSKATEAAFKKFELLVTAELFHTATTMISDIVLPAAILSEHDAIAYWPAWFGNVRACPKVVDPPGEAWADYKIINELAKRVGLGRYFWENEEDALDYMLKPMGVTWKKFRDEIHFAHGEINYDPEKVTGYDSPSGKVEIYCQQLKDMNVDPLPLFEDLKKPLMGQCELTDEYPFSMTNYKSEVFMLSGYRGVKELRKKSMVPTAYLSPEAAEELGLKNGDWIYVESRVGRIRQRLSIQPGGNPKIVNVEFGWGDYGYKDANNNLLTSYKRPWDYPTGCITLRGVAVKVYKAPAPDTDKEAPIWKTL